MYLPAHFAEQRPDVLERFVRSHPLGMLVTLDGRRPDVDHVPMMLETAPYRLLGHVARANGVARRVPDDEEVLVVFRGADHYVTPSWYPAKQVDGRVVPTWNYATVHVRGRIRWFDAPERLRTLVEALTRTHEAPRAAPWSVHDAPEDYLASMLRMIVGFEIEVSEMTGKFKASQNRAAADRASVARGLAEEGVAAAVAAELVRDPGR